MRLRRWEDRKANVSPDQCVSPDAFEGVALVFFVAVVAAVRRRHAGPDSDKVSNLDAVPLTDGRVCPSRR